MKAIDFIQKFGWDYAKERLDYCKNARLVGMEIDLKRYVDAYELVQNRGGLDEAKDHTMVLALIEEYEQLKQLQKAIALVEEVESCDENN